MSNIPINEWEVVPNYYCRKCWNALFPAMRSPISPTIWGCEECNVSSDKLMRDFIRCTPDELPRWRPFETAPTGHGELIVVWRKDSGIFVAQWILDIEDPDENGHWFDHTGEDLTGDLPTLWQPLPSEPEIQE